jgi:hypothetical protein
VERLPDNYPLATRGPSLTLVNRQGRFEYLLEAAPDDSGGPSLIMDFATPEEAAALLGVRGRAWKSELREQRKSDRATND